MSGMTQTPVATFKGRSLELKLPNGSQILVWNRAVKQFDELATELEGLPSGARMTDDQANRHRKALNRLSDMVFSLLASEDDKEWLEDEIMAENIVDTDLIDLFGTFGDAIAEYSGDEGDGEKVAKPKPVKKSAAKRVK